MHTSTASRWIGMSLGVVLLGLVSAPGPAQEGLAPPAPPDQEPLLPRPFDRDWWTGRPDDGDAGRRPRVRLFRMPTGFLLNPISIDPDPAAVVNDPDALPLASGTDLGLLPLQAAMGADNPFFDFRRPGDPGGLGYYRWFTQVQLFEDDGGGCTLALQAVRPAGLEFNGVAEGPTVFSPALAWFRDLGAGAAVHGFVGKDLRVNAGWEESLRRDLQYGLAVHGPVPGFDSGSLPTLHVFVEALGRYRPDEEAGQRLPLTWELLPGLHWQKGDAWWLSGGLLLPLGGPKVDPRFWQLTCSWQF
jgi:hypothetical protein